MDLYDIYTEYKNGNLRAFDELARDKVRVDGSGAYDGSCFEITIVGLDNLINRLFYEYRKPHIRGKKEKYPKFFENIYCGTLEDMRKDVVLILYQIFNDNKFTAKNEKELYGELKNRAVTFINDSLGTSAYSVSDIITDNETGAEVSIYAIAADNEAEEREAASGYMVGFKELMEILDMYDIRDLCQINAEVQQNIIELIYKYYVPLYNEADDTVKYPSEEYMIEMYRKEYGKAITQSQYSRALGSIFRILCDCTTAFKGVQSRRDFIKGGNNPLLVENLPQGDYPEQVSINDVSRLLHISQNKAYELINTL